MSAVILLLAVSIGILAYVIHNGLLSVAISISEVSKAFKGEDHE